jgi:hypothetical protein
LNKCRDSGLYPAPTGIIRKDKNNKIILGTNRINALIETYIMMNDDD